MKILKFVLLLTLSVAVYDVTFAADIVAVYPADDAMGLLYDNEAIADWESARGYQGDLAQPIAKTTEVMAVRSDNGVGTYRIYRVSDTFDLSGVPEAAVINSAKLKLYKTEGNNQGDVTVVITSHQREVVSEMQDQDWSIENFSMEEFSRSQLLDNQYTEFVFNPSGLNYLNSKKGEVATLGLLTHFDFDNVVPFGYYIQAAGWYTLDNPGTEFDPYLEITYTVPEVEAEIDREAFVALVTEATSEEKRVTQRFFVASANQLFDLIEGDRDRLALLHLKVFKVLLKARGIDDAELLAAIETLKGQLQE